MKIVNALKDDALVTKPASRDGKKLSKSERQRIQQEQMQIKVNLINDLTSLIPVYSDAVLAFIRAFQQIAICIEAVNLFSFCRFFCCIEIPFLSLSLLTV